MKKIILLATFFMVHFSSFAQTATDFTAMDCAGNTVNLFSETNSGKVIVLCWVMPCGSCVGPALTTMNVVNSFVNSHPNTVYMYLVDDHGDTPCGLLENWKNNSGISGAVCFSDASINMANYGAFGMPKIVVVGGGSHHIFYNANDVVSAADLQSAINSALQVIGIEEQSAFATSLTVSPNPSSEKSEIKFSLTENSPVEITLYNLFGAEVKEIFHGKLEHGEHSINFSTSGIAPGTYILRVSNGTQSKSLNLLITG